ncbi:MAG: helix-turn-helix transcriptional regulator, partial [Rhodospirillales bacterium]|nr:helix-turn-helix transcriptional regulator [Rhodospirillales bacterium]
ATRIEDSKKLHDLVRRTIGGCEKSETETILALPRKSSVRPLAVMAYPRVLANMDEPSAVILIHDPDLREGPSETDIAHILGITISEARLAKLLADGKPLRSACRMLGLTTESGRTYLKRIFQKTGTTRQAELVRVVLTSTFTG